LLSLLSPSACNFNVKTRGLEFFTSLLGAIAKKAWDDDENPLNQEDGLTKTFNQTTEKTKERIKTG
jgi:hypothetical protein